MKRDLTQLEIPRLPETYNLTDGHAHRPLDKNEQAIVEGLSQLFAAAEREQQPELEREYIQSFYNLTRQTVDNQKTHYMLLPSASISLEIVANFIRLNNMDLALTEPCFDNLANIFKRHNIPLEPIPDTCLEMDNLGGLLDALHSKAVCVVSPNNPTGISYTKANFEQLVRFCKLRKKLLILDTSFRAYRPADDIFDEYRILQENDLDYIVIEDTGKTWPTKELKVSVLAVSPAIYDQIYGIYTDFIYHHSPFVIKLVSKFIQNSMTDKLNSVHDLITSNREALYEAIAGTFLEPADKPYSSVAWLAIKNDLTATEMTTRLAQSGVFVLPGNYFFWGDKSMGDKFLRIALARDPKVFRVATTKLREVLLAS